MNKTLIKIRELIQTIQYEAIKEPDDFNYKLMKDLQTFSSETLYQLTRGAEGTPNLLQLQLLQIQGEK